MRTTHPEDLATRLTTEEAFRRIEVLSIWQRLQAANPGLADFDLGDAPEKEITRAVSILGHQAERDLCSDVAEWLRESGSDRVRVRARVRAMLARTRAIRAARNDLFDVTVNAARAARLIDGPSRSVFDIVNMGLARVAEAV